MEFVRRNTAIVFVALISLGLGVVILLTVLRVGQEAPVAPTAPEKPQAVEGSPVPDCTLTFAISLPSPSPSPSPTPTPTPTPSPTPSPTPTPRPTPSPTPTPTPTPTPRPTPTPSPSPSPTPSPLPMCVDIRVCLVEANGSCNFNIALTSLQPGDTVQISVVGDLTGATNGRFRIWGLSVATNQYVLLSDQGGDGWVEACTSPSVCNIDANGRYYTEFTLLPGYRGYRFESEIFYPGAGWR